MSYKINDCMLGPDATSEDAQNMVDELTKLGYDVEFTSDGGLINERDVECPIPDDVWYRVLDNLPTK